MDSQEQLSAIKQLVVKTAIYIWHNWKKIIMITAIITMALFTMGGKIARYVEKPEFCQKCHSMKPYYSSWVDSSHQSVSCFSCHFGYTPVIKPKPLPMTQKNTWFIELGGKTINISKQLNYVKNQVASINVRFYNFRSWMNETRSKSLDLRKVYIMAIGGSTSGGSSFWKNCTKCHNDLFQPIAKNDSFGHNQHLKKGMPCNDCHRSTVHGRAAKPSKEQCSSCHENLTRPSSHKTGLFKLLHGRSYVKTGGCEICHKKGINEPKCINCHKITMPHSEDYTMYHIDDINKIGIKNCLYCHKENEGLIGGVAPGAKPCQSCHGPNTPHKGYQSILRSHGALAVKKGTKGCLGCHISKQCTNCHGMTIPHELGFIKKHTSDAKKYGFDKCLNCHQNYGTGQAMYCGKCHVVDMPHPPGWQSAHGKVDKKSCEYCHSPQNPANPTAPWSSKNFCNKCHYIKPHFETHWKGTMKLEQCYGCHGKKRCGECHSWDL